MPSLRFGKQIVIETDGDRGVVREQVFANYETVKKVTTYTETVRVKDRKEVLAEYLKLMDKWKAGEIDLPGIEVIRDKTGNMRVEKNWIIPA